MRSSSTISSLFGDGSTTSLDVVDEQLQAEVLKGLFRATTSVSFDRFVLLELVGSGSMGAVFAAYDPKLDRKIALKVTRSADERGHARHLSEARALAKVNHPNVVTVHDAGEHDGSLFVAMELVEGASLAAFLAEQEQSEAEIVRLFIDAGRGLAAAHAAGVVHRDFKPANVLVGESGRVYVADFGLAKTYDELGTVPNTQTGNAGERGGGTPLYMAPEQARGEAADARSDQFAFFVALVEALTGEVPFRIDRSTSRLEAIAGGLGSVAVSRGLLRVVRRGLSLDPSERFPSMDAAVGALLARQGRQRRWAGGVIATVAAGAFFWPANQPAEIPCTDRSLDDEWATQQPVLRAALLATRAPQAEDAWHRARAKMGAFVGAWSDAANEACHATRVAGEHSEHVLDVRMACLDQQRAQLRTLWTIFAGLEAAEVEKTSRLLASLPDVEPCGRVEQLLGITPLPEDSQARQQIFEARKELGSVRTLRQVRPEEAKASMKRAETLVEKADYPPLRAEVDVNRGFIEYEAGEYDVAQASFKQALWLAESTRHDEVGIEAAQGVAACLLQQADFDRVTDWVDLARAINRRIGVEDGVTAHVANQMTELELRRGEPERAVDWARRGVELARDERQDVTARSRLALALSHSGELEQARAAYAELLPRARKVWGDRNANLGSTLTSYGATLRKSGRQEEALEMMQEALDIVVEAHGAEHPTVPAIQINMATALKDLGRFEEAIESYEAGAASRARRAGPTHPDVAMSHVNVAEVLRQQDEPEAALERCRQASTLLPPDADRLFTTYAAMCEARSLLQLGRASEALGVIEPFARDDEGDRLAGLRESVGQAYVEALYETGRTDEALRRAHALVPFVRKAHGLSDGELSATERWLRSLED